MYKRGIINSAIFFIMLLQFMVVPFLGDVNNSGKLYLFIYLVLLCSLPFFYFIESYKISPILFIFFLLLSFFYISAWQSSVLLWPFLFSSILAVYLLFIMMLSHWINGDDFFFKRLVDSLLLFGLVAALLGLYEYVHFLVMGPTSGYLIANFLPSNNSIRVGGFYGQPNLFAVFLTVTLLAFFYRYLDISSHKSFRGFASLRFLPFFMVSFVFFLTGSRAGFLSLFFILAFLSWLVSTQRYLYNNLLSKKEFILLLLCLFSAFLLYKVSFVWLPTSSWAERSLSHVGLSGDVRYVFWMSAVLIFLDNFWFGTGLGTFGIVQDAYGPLAKEILTFVPYEAIRNTNWAHNEILQLLAEGGGFVAVIIFFLLGLFLRLIWKHFYKNKNILNDGFLFSHLFLFPFIIQSMLSWPFRSPALLILFFSFLGILLAQYPMQTFWLSKNVRKIICVSVLLAFCFTIVMFRQELRIGSLRQVILKRNPPVGTLDEVSPLIEKPYSKYRVLSKVLPIYTHEALIQDDKLFAETILPMSEQLVDIEGARWQWYNLSRLYLKVGRTEEARIAILKAINLMPSDETTWAFLHYLNMIKASRETGRPLESFFPHGREIDFNVMELLDE